MSKYIIAHDLGTTGNKATLFSTEGKMIDSIVFPYEAHFFNGNWAEQDPADWWTAVVGATRAMASKVNKEDVLAISFSGHMMGCLPVDAEGNPLRPHILWADMRATEEAEYVASHISREEFYRITGHRLSSSYTLSKILWIKNHEPEIYEKTYKFLHAKDYMVYRLTGRMYTDYSDASGSNMFDLHTFTWSQKIIEAAGIDPDKLPEVVSSTTVAGTLLPEAAELCGLSTRTKIVLGAGDGATATVGAGSVAKGISYACLGTSAWIAKTVDAPVQDKDMTLVSWAHAVPGKVISMSTMQAAGASFSWMKNNLCGLEDVQSKDGGKGVYDRINDLIASAPAGSNGIFFLPYLMGERCPRWNPDAKGCFIGMKMENNRSDMLRSVIEGIAYNLRVIIETMNENGENPDDIALVGGLAKGAIQRKIFADVWNRRVRMLNFLEEAGSIGAAIIAGVGIGEFESFDVVNRFIKEMGSMDPDPEVKDIYDRGYEVFNRAYKALYPLFPDI